MVRIIKGAGFIRVLGLLVSFSVFLAGCAPKAYVSTIGTAKEVKEVCIKRQGQKNPLLDKLVEKKIESALREKGIKVVKECGEYSLTYDYGTVPKQMYVPRITYLPGETYTITIHTIRDNQVVPEYYTIITPTTPVYYTDVETFYTHFLALVLYKGDEVEWAGEVYIETDSADIRSVLDILVKVLMEYFGKDTGRVIEVEVK